MLFVNELIKEPIFIFMGMCVVHILVYNVVYGYGHEAWDKLLPPGRCGSRRPWPPVLSVIQGNVNSV